MKYGQLLFCNVMADVMEAQSSSCPLESDSSDHINWYVTDEEQSSSSATTASKKPRLSRSKTRFNLVWTKSVHVLFKLAASLGKHIAQYVPSHSLYVTRATGILNGTRKGQCISPDLVPLTVRVFHADRGRVASRFLNMCLCSLGTAAPYFDKVQEVFSSKSIPWCNCVALSVDSTSVNVNSIKTRLEQWNPALLTLGCPCHFLQLYQN